MTPATANHLLSRLQMLCAPDRDLDAEIAVAIFRTVSTADDLVTARQRDKKGGDATHPGHYFISSRSGMSARMAPLYTASVDAALLLLPPDCDWLIGRGQVLPDEPPFGVQVFPPRSGRMIEMPPALAEGEHPDLAVAICIAAIAAIAKPAGAA